MEQILLSLPLAILPLLPLGARMDMVDLYKSGQAATVANRMGGESQLLYLAGDSLSIRTTAVSLFSVRMLPDSTLKVVRTYFSPDTTSITQHYTKHWRLLR